MTEAIKVKITVEQDNREKGKDAKRAETRNLKFNAGCSLRNKNFSGIKSTSFPVGILAA